MNRRLLAGTLVASIPMLTHTLVTAAAPADCATLVSLTIPDVTINAATTVAPGSFTPPGTQTAMALPGFCRVEATARPTSDSEIKFEVWIPPAEAWNGKFQGVGNGGYQGSISYTAMATALRRGYATASTDTGHTGDDVIFGQGHPEKVIDFGHRAIHVMTTSAKLVIRNAAGRFAERSYFVGCSSGGHQALSEAQRYPDDYDGIVAGAPANDRIRQTFGFLASWLATHGPDGTPLLTQPKLALLTKAAVASCDANDGLKDGLIDDPRRCAFNPATLACKAGVDEATCLGMPAMPVAPPLLATPTEGQEIVGDYESMGLTLRRHPLALLRGRLKKKNIRSAEEVANSRNGQFIRTAGIVTCRQRPATASGVIFVTLEDETGYVNLIVWNDLADRQRRELIGSRLLAVSGEVQREGRVVHILAKRLEDLSSLLGRLVTSSHDFH